jgi:uncharacterized protein (DUF58 family)
MVREFAAEDERKVTIYLDTRVPAEAGVTRTLREKIEAENAGRDITRSPAFERAVTQTAALVAHLIKTDAEVRLITPGEAGEFGSGTRHLHDILRRLAVVEAAPRASESPVPPPNFEQIFTEMPESHNIVITVLEDGASVPPAGTQVITFGT